MRPKRPPASGSLFRRKGLGAHLKAKKERRSRTGKNEPTATSKCVKGRLNKGNRKIPQTGRRRTVFKGTTRSKGLASNPSSPTNFEASRVGNLTGIQGGSTVTRRGKKTQEPRKKRPRRLGGRVRPSFKGGSLSRAPESTAMSRGEPKKAQQLRQGRGTSSGEGSPKQGRKKC